MAALSPAAAAPARARPPSATLSPTTSRNTNRGRGAGGGLLLPAPARTCQQPCARPRGTGTALRPPRGVLAPARASVGQGAGAAAGASGASGRDDAGAPAPLFRRRRASLKGPPRRRPTAASGRSGPAATSASSSSSTTTTTGTNTTTTNNSNNTTPDEQRTAALSLAACLAAGALLGTLAGPADPALPPWAQLPSSVLGWSYTACWTASFWPQVLANHRRGNVDGLSLDYLALSAVGFAAYTAYTGSLYLSDGVRQAYEGAHGGAAADVQLADVVFAAHALLVTGVTAAQALPASARTEGQRLSPFAAGACGAALALVGGVWLSVRRTCAAAAGAASAAAAAAAVASAAPGLPDVAAVAAAADGAAAAAAADCAPLLDVVYALGAVKIGATLIKYAPQVLSNHRRRSTSGWALEAVLLDLAGGVLSLGQVGLDAAARGDLSVVTGNPAKLGIGAISLLFDVVFLLQHYVLYREGSGGEGAGRGVGAAAGSAASASRSPRPALGGGGGAGGGSGGQRAGREPVLALARARPSPLNRSSEVARRSSRG